MTIIPAICSSIFEVCATQPIDVIKTHYQTNTKVVYTFGNLYSGFIPRACGNIPSRTIFLYSQDFFQTFYSDNNIDKNKRKILTPLSAGFCQTLVDTPFEVLKINKIMNINNTFLYTGFLPHCARNIIFLTFVYNFRQFSKNNNDYKTEQNILKKSLYGAIGGMIGSYISHPFDTIKTKIQSNQSIKNLCLNDYMKGAHLRASMSMMNMFISLTMFEVFKILDVF